MKAFPSEYAAFLQNVCDAEAKIVKLKESISSFEEENREFVRLVLGTSLAESIDKCERAMQGTQKDLQAEDEEIKKLSLFEEYKSLSKKKAILSDPWPQLLSLLKKTGAKGTEAVSQTLVGDDFDRVIKAYQQKVIKLSKQANNPKVLKKRLLMGIDENSDILIDERLKELKAGDFITFGRYPQTATGEDMTPIEWQILDRKDNWILVISKFGLDTLPYHNRNEFITWEKCSLREWLNSSFMGKAFDEEELEAIKLSQVENRHSWNGADWKTVGGNDSNDMLFLLSNTDAIKYFANSDSRRCIPTDYAIQNGTYVYSGTGYYGAARLCGYGNWWLRSPGKTFQNYADRVGCGGWTDCSTTSSELVTNNSTMIRPAMWVNLTSDAISPVDQKAVFRQMNPDLNSIQVGDVIMIGTYPQYKPFNKRTPIEWTILAKEDKKMLAISRFALDKRQFENGRSSTAWKDSNIRFWLNRTFFEDAFSESEQAIIAETELSTEKSLSDADPVKTRDKVFLLSVPEVNQYFSNNEKRKCELTIFALGQVGNNNWWLRTQGEKANYAAEVSTVGGYIFQGGSRVDVTQAVRPAIWIEIDKDDENFETGDRKYNSGSKPQ